MTWTKEEALEGLQDRIDKIWKNIKDRKDWDKVQTKRRYGRWEEKHDRT